MKEIIEQHKLWLKDEGGKRADLSYANLRGADMTSADLRFADMTSAVLTGAILTDAILTGAKLFNTIGNGKEIRTFQTEFYTINITKDIIWIGCKAYTREQWLAFTDEEISDMDKNALKFWNKYKLLITLMGALEID